MLKLCFEIDVTTVEDFEEHEIVFNPINPLIYIEDDEQTESDPS